MGPEQQLGWGHLLPFTLTLWCRVVLSLSCSHICETHAYKWQLTIYFEAVAVATDTY